MITQSDLDWTALGASAAYRKIYQEVGITAERVQVVPVHATATSVRAV